MQFLSSIHQHLNISIIHDLNKAPQKKKRQTSAKRHDDILTPQLLRYNKIDSSGSENTSEEIRPISPCIYACSGYLRMKQMTLLQGLSSARSKTVLQDSHSPTRSALISKQNLSEKAVQIHQIRTSLQY